MRSVIERHQREAFVWGESDCAVMCGDVIWAITGVNVMRGYWWGSERGAIVALRRSGVSSAVEAFTAGRCEIPPGEACRGDLGAIAEHEGEPLMSPAIIDGAFAFSKNKDGPVIVPRSAIVRAWAV